MSEKLRAPLHPIVEAYRREWPPAFAGPQLTKLSGGFLFWTTIQNRRSRREIPAECFVPGRPTVVLRDPFLDWLAEWLSTRNPGAPHPQRPRRRRRPDGTLAAAQ